MLRRVAHAVALRLFWPNRQEGALRELEQRLSRQHRQLERQVQRLHSDLEEIHRSVVPPDRRAYASGDADPLQDSETLRRQRTRHLVEVREPLVLVSQLQRSGGTLLSQLFDAHPQLHAHPQELHTGHPKKEVWPELDLGADPGEWFATLYEGAAGTSFQQGYQKAASRRTADGAEETFPFLFPPVLQRAIFDAAVERLRPDSRRAIFDCYMTSYFNAWLDNQNLYARHKRWITAFAARLSSYEESVAGFFETYPDGHLISIIRDPRSWYLSARRYRDLEPSEHKDRDYGTIESAIDLWVRSAAAAEAARGRYGDRVYLMSFEDLLTDTESAMRSLASHLGIEFLPTLLEPTFNGLPIKADSSFAVGDHGVSTEPLTRYRELLGQEEIDYVDEHATPLYERVMALRT